MITRIVYTAFVIDAFPDDRGWDASTSKVTAFVQRAIRQAAMTRLREGHPLQGNTIHPSDYAEPCVKPRIVGMACTDRVPQRVPRLNVSVFGG